MLRGGEGRGEGERHHQSIPFCSHTQPIKPKTPAIKADQASSRQTMKKPNTTIPSANGAAPYQPKATPWVCPLRDTSPARAAHPANQGKNPCNRASSRLIKASAKNTGPLGSSPKLGDWNSELPHPFSFASLRLRAFALKTPAIKPHQASSSLIKPNQAKSRQTRNVRLPTASRSLDVGCSKLDVGCFSTPCSAPHSRLPLAVR